MRSQSFLLGSREELHLKAGSLQSLGEIDQRICNCYLISRSTEVWILKEVNSEKWNYE